MYIEGLSVGFLSLIMKCETSATGLQQSSPPSQPWFVFPCQANHALGLPHDCRDYASVNAILESLGVASVELMTNNPLKVDAIGLPVTGVRALKPNSLHTHHADYLRVKHQREVHVLESLMQTGLDPSGPKAHLAEALSAIVSHNASTTASSEGSDTDAQSGADADADVGDVLDLADGVVLPSATLGAKAEARAHKTRPHAQDLPIAPSDDDTRRVDEAIMRRALRLALRGRMSAPPNPWVGCILVRAGTVIGEGFHHRAGEPHAEIMALTDAAQKYCAAQGEEYDPARRAELVAAAAAGATAYVTLEPCHHTGRTGPCDEALLAAGIARVAVAVVDPDERVSAKGLAKLRNRGVEVVTGVLEEDVALAMRPYLEQRRTQRAYCVLKTALSIDGKVACADGTSQWITGPEARQDVHILRARSQAVLVGAGTAVVDRPRLTPRVTADDIPAANTELRAQLTEQRAQPLLRVVLDGQGRVTDGPLLDTSVNPTLVFTSAQHCPIATRNRWTKAGVRVVEAPAEFVSDVAGSRRLQLDLGFVLQHLAQKEGVLQVMVEGGAAVHAALLNAGLADELHVYTGPKLLGGSALAWPSAPLASTISEAKCWTLCSTRRVGDSDLLCIYRPAEAPAS
jgi:diaminohydroxyphosphoribosylaminopyrimidine deaminase/5-amino-6-(5-phosphoribosylamino)uracil reductase